MGVHIKCDSCENMNGLYDLAKTCEDCVIKLKTELAAMKAALDDIQHSKTWVDYYAQLHDVEAERDKLKIENARKLTTAVEFITCIADNNFTSNQKSSAYYADTHGGARIRIFLDEAAKHLLAELEGEKADGEGGQ